MPRAARDPSDTRTLVEASELGWWYSAGLPNGRLIVAFMTDADLLPTGFPRVRAHWHRQLELVPHTRARVDCLSSDTPLNVVTARTAKLDHVAGKGWLAVGDAALTFDPLSSHGITTALHYGLGAAVAIERWSEGRRDALTLYEREAQSDFDQYLRARAVQYGRERRWAASAFWRRRHSTSGAESAR